MDTETKKQFEKLGSQIDKLATMTAEGFSDVYKQIDVTKTHFSDLTKEIRSDIASVRRDIERLPDEIDETYSNTINDLLDRVSILEKRLAAVEAART